jgi:hypothetical protein
MAFGRLKVDELVTSTQTVSVDALVGIAVDGDKGDITVSGSGTVWSIDNGAVDTAALGGDITIAGKALLDDADAAAQRTTLGLGGSATLNVGTTAGTVAAGDDGRFTTDLTYTAGTRVLASSTGADATLPLFTSTDAGLAPLSGGGTTNFLRADGTWAAPASGGTPGGTTGQIQWNSAGSFAGVGGSTVGATGDITLSLNGAASTPPLSFTGTWFTGGTSTTTKPHVLIEPTGTTSTGWSTSGTGFGVNAPSGFAGNLLDLQVNGISFLRFTASGELTGRSSTGRIAFETTGTRFVDWVNFNNVFRTGGSLYTVVRSDGGYAFSSSASVLAAIDVAIARDSANVVAITNGSTGVGYLRATPVAVSALPAAATVGAGTRGFVSDSTVAASGNFGATVTGGGSNNVPVFSDGTNWLIG